MFNIDDASVLIIHVLLFLQGFFSLVDLKVDKDLRY